MFTNVCWVLWSFSQCLLSPEWLDGWMNGKWKDEVTGCGIFSFVTFERSETLVSDLRTYISFHFAKPQLLPRFQLSYTLYSHDNNPLPNLLALNVSLCIIFV